MRMHSALIVAFCIAVAAPAARGSAERLAGSWQRTSSSLKVRVDSWGENCGPAPKSYANNTVADVEITAQGRHLVFTKGGLRTDRCSSSNPKLATKSEQISANRWERVCETPASDSKFEHDEYVFEAHGENEIEYNAKSKYEWSLNGDKCVLFLEERRAFVRKEGTAPPAVVQPAPDSPEEGAGEKAACEREGSVRRLQISPKDVRLGPGERVCFKAYGFDASGCRFETQAAWTASQKGVTTSGLLAQNGCFKAGATAAESEGAYDVVAQFEGKRAEASVTVVFPDYGALARARLNPTGDTGDATGDLSSAGPGANPGVSEAPPISGAASGSRSKALTALLVVAAAVLSAALVFVGLRLRRAFRSSDTGRSGVYEGGERGEEYTERQAGGQPPVGGSPPGMVCPTCNRGYDGEARFCPHDSSRLLPYPEWRSRRRSAR